MTRLLVRGVVGPVPTQRRQRSGLAQADRGYERDFGGTYGLNTKIDDTFCSKNPV